MAWLLDSLRLAGAHDQAAALLGRDPAARAPLADPGGVARLLASLRRAGAQRPGRRAGQPGRRPRPPLSTTPRGVASLLDSLRGARADDQAAALLARDPAARAPLADPGGVAACWPACGWRARTTRPPRWPPGRRPHPPRRPGRRGRLLASLRLAGAHDQAAALATGPPPTPLDNPDGVAACWRACGEAGAHDQAAALASRAAAHAPLDDPEGVAWLLGTLREAGADDQAAALLARDPAARAPLADPGGVAVLLDRLRLAGAHDQAAALATRAAAHAPLADPWGVAWLLGTLRRVGAHDQAAALLPVTPPPTPPSTIRTAWPSCWPACGRRARTGRPLRWPPGYRRSACSGSSSSRQASRISSVSDGRPTAPRPRHGAGKTWTYSLFSDRRVREATLPVDLPPAEFAR